MKNSNIFTSPHWHNVSEAKQNLVIPVEVDPSNTVDLSLQINSLLGIKIAEMSGEPIIQYNDLASINDGNLNDFQDHIIPLLKQNGIDLIYFHNVKSDSNLYQLIKNIGEIIAHKKAPYIDLTQFSNLDDYLKSLSANSRKSKRRALKKLETTFQVEFETSIDAQIDAELFNQVIQLKKDQLTRLGQTSRLFESKAEIENLKNIILKPNKDFKCIFSLLKCDGEIAAAEIGYLHNGTYYSFLGAMNEAFQSYSPGSCQLIKTIEWALAAKIQTFDFLAPDDAYKSSWTDNLYVEVYDFILPLSFKGQIIGNLYLKTLRPLLKKAYLYVKASK
uniref:BioF2-like acetyltransferase domain-containing protein n=1 Tax=OCS116 cluster bacterium TaxID=2030921 RepID=A0A2A4Z8P1_9PROT